MKVSVKISTRGHPNTTAVIVKESKRQQLRGRLVPVKAQCRISCWMTGLSAGSETQCETSTPIYCAGSFLLLLLALPHIHLSLTDILVLIFCPSQSQVRLPLSLISHSFTDCTVLQPFSHFFPMQHSWGLGKGVSALVSPWGETATDSSLPHCFLNSSWSKQILYFCLPSNSSNTESYITLKHTLFGSRGLNRPHLAVHKF